jgi:hypothetical protein
MKLLLCFVVDYAEQLMAELLVSYTTEREALMHAIDDIDVPQTLTDGMQCVDKAEAIAAYRARFNLE